MSHGFQGHLEVVTVRRAAENDVIITWI